MNIGRTEFHIDVTPFAIWFGKLLFCLLLAWIGLASFFPETYTTVDVGVVAGIMLCLIA